MKTYHLGYISLIFLSCTVKAAVTLDGTVGQRLDLVGPDYQITQDLGQRTGHNLFHSFGEFSLSQGEIATFSGEHSIKNVIGRVTGGHPSHIDGTIRNTIPKADLYLINPAGMMFGKNAQLDVQGAFHASTAGAIHFEDGEIFNALHPEQSSFSSANPSAFGFLTSQPQPLTLTGSQLAVPQQAHLSLIGGDIHIQADIASQQLATLQAQSGHIYIVSIADKGQVTLNPSENNRLSNGNILIQSAQLNTAANQAGQIYIRGGQFVLRNSLITASTGNDNGGAIDIQADDIEISYGSRLTTSSFGTGQGGDINLQATNDMQFFGTDGNGIGNQVFSNVNHTGQGVRSI